MANGHVKIPVERYEELREFERNSKEMDDKDRETIIHLIKFVMNIANSYTHSDDKIHEAADKSGFRIRYEKNNLITSIGKTGIKEYVIKE